MALSSNDKKKRNNIENQFDNCAEYTIASSRDRRKQYSLDISNE